VKINETDKYPVIPKKKGGTAERDLKNWSRDRNGRRGYSLSPESKPGKGGGELEEGWTDNSAGKADGARGTPET